GAKGTPAVCWNSAVFPVCRNVGYQLGYLTWLFSHFSITLVGVCLIPTFLHVFERDTPMDLVI
ncbi:hypothetical protein, partial [Bifidobacterium pseudocatenulatum]|uniref:hypothetical protein n=1 Tax=Bifidobacterium pseudocatenulatum TaxID=28026 RepID=UPI0022E6ADEA